MSSDHFRDLIARRLKGFREENGLSLDAAARATSVSKAMLGQIERMESTPTIATLWKIASGLDISFSSFFAVGSAPAPEDAPFPDDPDMRVRIVFPFDPATGLEMFEVVLANGHHQISPPHRHGVVEHVVVLRGRMEVRFEGRWHELAEGDAVKFHADVGHEYRTDGEAAFHNVIRYV